MYYFKPIATPVGELKLVASDRGLVGILWENDDPRRTRFLPQTRHDDLPVFLATEQQLAEYFAGERRCFELPLDFVGTDFQKKVWQALVAIPFGETRSYSQIAREIGHPLAVRAVGAANGRNPLSIIAPCHRVIGANGKLTGFAGGLEIKAFLLALEAPQARLALATTAQPDAS
ncbi:glycosyltransferase [Pantoea conspicua]|uniref:Methylated-DNA--protein-cysteine methyltransferase n=1 Tax=Pantoea conspicua TaxID=472705 RepID=A0A1X1C1Z2_9GAMM|nr:methylated-DNA--[protein]-cysteine S-methyltransferase [Pantoea conspicua]ORM55560.1 glycosyltransferase [Pantoea conspicua]